MDLSFLKLRLCEADLILVDDLEGNGRDRDWALAARAILDRRRGAGALRLAVIARAEEDLWLRVFDAEGREDAALFDAAVCSARYLLDSGRAGSERVRLRSGSGELSVDVLDGTSLGMDLGPLLSVPEAEALDMQRAGEKRSIIEAEGERFEVLPLGLRPFQARDGAAIEKAVVASGPRAVAVLCQGGTKSVRAKIGAAGTTARPPSALPIRIISRRELRTGRFRDPRLDALSIAGLALGAAVFMRLADDEALVRLGDGLLWAEMTASGSLYVAGRPEYAYRGEFHFDEEEESGTRS